jgi:hypothetical protein
MLHISKKFRLPFVILLFVIILFLNFLYGSMLYAKITGKEEAYKIGEMCDNYRSDCENQYFKNYLDNINTISNQSRDYFAQFYINNNRIDYTGNCPCPYDTDTRGYSCGGRSSYSKGGKISMCYSTDVSDQLVAEKKQAMLDEAKAELNNAVQADINVYSGKTTLIALVIIFGIGLIYFKKELF